MADRPGGNTNADGMVHVWRRLAAFTLTTNCTTQLKMHMAGFRALIALYYGLGSDQTNA